jgi:putative tryptophan/tyrosine transport system substrate-binding protein
MGNNKFIIGIVALVAAAGGLAYYLFATGSEMKTVAISSWATNSEFDRSVQSFKQSLEKKGYVEGKNIKYIYGVSEANLDKQREIIASFIEQEVDLIYSLTTPGTMVAKELTGKMSKPIPVVFSICTYPVESNLIASLEKSGNNLVGTRNYVPFPQQYYAFEQLFPDTKSLAIVRRKGEPNSTNQAKEIKALLGERGIKVIDIAAVDLDDIRKQLNSHIKDVDAVFSTCDTLTHNGGDKIIAELSKKYKKPSFACNKSGILLGQLMGNIGDFAAIAEISGEQAALVLEGADPSWLKTESPRESFIVLNETTMKALGIKADEAFSQSVKETVQ